MKTATNTSNWALKAMLWWLPMLAIGFANGTFRGLVLLQYFDDQSARQISSIMLVLLLGIFTWLVYPRLSILSFQRAIGIGAIWMLLTFAFETLAGLYGTGLTVEQILKEYDITEGKFWPFVLVGLLTLPSVVFALRNSRVPLEKHAN